MTPSAAPDPKVPTPVTIMLAGADLTKFKDRVRVLVDGQPVAVEPQITKPSEATLKVTMPPKPAGKTQVVVRVYVGQVLLPGERTFTYTP